jgi:NDP-sugar pyrophosphorylase family protein
MKAVVLAGGKGSRLAPYTRILPKPLMPIGEMPILEVILRQMKCAGIDEVVLAVGHLSGLLQAFFQNGNNLGIRIRYSFEDCPLGTAGPIALVEDLDDTFMVTNGDVLTTLNEGYCHYCRPPAQCKDRSGSNPMEWKSLDYRLYRKTGV